nr:phytanoyl-CoA dioxygenase family protein [Planctomycetota bacterium]
MTFILTDDERALLPAEEDVAFYREHGWYISRPLFTQAQLDRVVAASERFYAGAIDLPLPAGAPAWGWKPEQGDVLRKNDWASLQNRELGALVRSPVLAAVAAVLAGTDEIRLWHDQLLYKPVDRPERKNNVGWHTDRGYWKTCSSSAMLTAWIPFHDCDETMGTVNMIDGSHRWPDNTEKLDFFNPDLTALEREFITGGKPVLKVPMDLRAGQVSFHNCLTIHGSGPNRSDRARRSIAVHMQD